MRQFQPVQVFLKRYYVGDSEIRIHCRTDTEEFVQGWLYHQGDLTDTILTIDSNKGDRLAKWFLKAAD